MVDLRTPAVDPNERVRTVSARCGIIIVIARLPAVALLAWLGLSCYRTALWPAGFVHCLVDDYYYQY